MVQSFFYWLYLYIYQWEILALHYEIPSPEVKKKNKWKTTILSAFHSCPFQPVEGHSRLVLLSPVVLSHNCRLFCYMSLKEFLCLCHESLPSLFWLHRMHIGIVLSFTQTVCPLQWRYVFIRMVWQKLPLDTDWHWILYFTFICIMNLNSNVDRLSGFSHGRKHYKQVSKSQMKPSENSV